MNKFIKSDYLKIKEQAIGYVSQGQYITINVNDHNSITVHYNDVKTNENGEIELRVKLFNKDNETPRLYTFFDKETKSDTQLVEASKIVELLILDGAEKIVSKYNKLALLSKV